MGFDVCVTLSLYCDKKDICKNIYAIQYTGRDSNHCKEKAKTDAETTDYKLSMTSAAITKIKGMIAEENNDKNTYYRASQ